ncbi:MAG TPA: DUF177 domain-containing protein [Steroidobacteraceae bacterium]|nr:DUF177 domain-containing protein [Steroidobacteraceae bacterium]
MLQGWSKLLDIDPLADRGEELEFSIPLGEFARLAPQPLEGLATGRVRFAREGALATAEVRVRATPRLTCQRCLGPMDLVLDGGGRAAIVASPEEAERVPEPVETVLAPDHRISIRDLVEEELLLSWPLVPRHPASECAAGGADEPAEPGPQAGPAPAQKPFEQLAELFRRR